MDKPFSAQTNFAGRTALVTGGASGIGFAVARQLAELGAKIAIADVSIDGAKTAAGKLDGAEVMVVEVDVRDPEASRRSDGSPPAPFSKAHPASSPSLPTNGLQVSITTLPFSSSPTLSRTSGSA